MRIELLKTDSPSIPGVEKKLPHVSACNLDSLNSSLKTSRSRPKHRAFVLMKAFYYHFKERLLAFLKWFRSWFITPEEEEDEVGYYFKPGANGDERVCCLVRKGKGTDAQIRLRHTSTDLLDVTITNERDKRDIIELIDKLMDEGNIHEFKTTHLVIAHHLWKSRLKTQSVIRYKLTGASPLDQFIRGLLRTAASRSLDREGSDAFLKIQSMMVRAVVQEEMEEAGGIEIDANRCKARIQHLERQLNHTFSMPSLRRLAQDAKETTYLQAFDKITAGSVAQRDFPAVEFDLFLQDLLALAESTKTPIDRNVMFPSTTFKRRI